MRRLSGMEYFPSILPPVERCTNVFAEFKATYPAPRVPAELGTVTFALLLPATVLTHSDTLAAILAAVMVLPPLLRLPIEMVA